MMQEMIIFGTAITLFLSPVICNVFIYRWLSLLINKEASYFHQNSRDAIDLNIHGMLI
jgi:hypothetical protein